MKLSSFGETERRRVPRHRLGRMDCLRWVAPLLAIFMATVVQARTQILLREAFSREFSLFSGAQTSSLPSQIVSREFSLRVETGPLKTFGEIVSREFSVVVATTDVPDPVRQLTVTSSPNGDTAFLDWTSYPELAQLDVVRYKIYAGDQLIQDLTGLSPYAIVPGGVQSFTVSNLTTWRDHYFVVVAEDALGGSSSEIHYAAAHVISSQIISREFSLFSGSDIQHPYGQIISREFSVLGTTAAIPDPITSLAVSGSPTGDQATLNWSGYDELGQQDVVRYDIYQSDGPFNSVAGLTPAFQVPAGTFQLSVSNLTVWRDHFFAVVPVDGLNQFQSTVHYGAAHVFAPQVISREFSLFSGSEPVGRFSQIVSREYDLLVPDNTIPDPVTGLASSFSAETSKTAYSAVDLDWSGYDEVKQLDVIRYRVYVGSSFFTDVGGLQPYEVIPAHQTHHTVRGLLGGTIYYFAVVAEDVLGQFNPTVRSRSAATSVGSLGDAGQLAIISGLDSLNFSWVPPTQRDSFLAHYHVYWDGSTNPITLDPSATTYLATGLPPASVHHFQLTTIDLFGTESQGVSLDAVTWLPNPTNLLARGFDGQARLTWTQAEPDPWVRSYAIYQVPDGATSISGLTPLLTTRDPWAIIGGVNNGSPVNLAVTTINLSGGEDPSVNPVTVIPVLSSTSFADLTLGGVTNPASAYAGQSIGVQWAVTNVGLASTAQLDGTVADHWVDRVILSPNNIFGDADDIVLGEFVHSGAMGVGEIYLGNGSVTIPVGVSGTVHLWVVANAVGQVDEGLNRGLNWNNPARVLSVLPAQAPVIVQPPVSAVVLAGTPVSFSVVATATPPITYQWKKDNHPIPLATSPTLTLPSPGLGDVGAYSVVVSNPAGQVESTPVQLTVNRAGQSLSFLPVGIQLFATNLSIPLVATASSGLSVEFTLDQGTGAILGTNLMVTQPGFFQLTAHQNGNEFFEPAAPVSRQFVVVQGPFGLVYQSDFQDQKTDDWSTISLITDTDGHSLLGLFQAEAVRLTLPSVPAGFYRLSFDFYAINTWDGTGDSPGCCGPDIFGVNADQTPVVNATFGGYHQGFSQRTPLGAGPFPGGTDSSGTDIRVFPGGEGGRYSLRFSPVVEFLHTGGDLTLDFIGNPSQPGQYYRGFLDEPWALDRVRVEGPETSHPVSQNLTFPALTTVDYADGLLVPLQAQVDSGLPVQLSVLSGPGTIQAGQLLVQGAGTIEVEARQDGNAQFLAALPMVQKLVVRARSQSIDFPQLGQVTFAPNLHVTLQAVATSGLPVSYQVIDGPGEVNGNVLAVHGAGSITVEAQQIGDKSTAAAVPVRQILVVDKALPILSWNQPAPIAYGTPLDAAQLNATSSVSGSFDYQPSLGTVLNLGDSQVLQAHFTPSDRADYQAADISTTLQVTNNPTPSGCSPPTAGIVAWWPLDREPGLSVTDRAGLYSAVRVGNPTAVDGRVRGALKLNAQNFVAVQSGPVLDLSEQDFSIEFWAALDSVNAGTELIPQTVFLGADEGSSGSTGLHLGYGGGYLDFQSRSGGKSPTIIVDAPFSPLVGQWNHIALVRNGHVFHLYVNGSEAAAAEYQRPLPLPQAPVTLGTAGGLGPVGASLDEVTVYTRALTREEVGAIAQAGSLGKCQTPWPVTLAVTLDTSTVNPGGVIQGTVTRDSQVDRDLMVRLEVSPTNRASIPAYATIPAGQRSASFQLTAIPLDHLAVATSAQVTAAASGAVSASSNFTIAGNLPGLSLTVSPSRVLEDAGSHAAQGTILLSQSVSYPVTVAISSSDPTVATVPATVTIPAFATSASFDIQPIDDGLVTGDRRATFTPGWVINGTTAAQGSSAMLTVGNVDVPQLRLVISPTSIPEGRANAGTGWIIRNSTLQEDLSVQLQADVSNKVVLPSGFVIPNGASSNQFFFSTIDNGIVDGDVPVNVTASAVGYSTVTNFVTVTDVDQPSLVVGDIQLPSSVLTGAPLTPTIRITNQGATATRSPFLTRVYLSPDNTAAHGVLVDQFTFNGALAPGQYFENADSFFAPILPGSYYVVVVTDAGGVIPELDRSVSTRASSVPVTVQAAYSATVRAGLHEAVAGTPIPLLGSASLQGSGQPAVGVPVDITITLRGITRVLTAITDQRGLFQTTFTPLPSEAGDYSIGASLSGVKNPPTQDTFVLYGFTVDTVGTVSITEGDSIATSTIVRNLSEVPLSGFRVASVSVPTGVQLSATTSASLLTGNGTNVLNIAVTVPRGVTQGGNAVIRLTTDQGASFDLNLQVNVNPLRPLLVANPSSLIAGMLVGGQRTVQFDVINVGGLESGPLTVQLPAVPWLTVSSTGTIASIQPGASNRVSLLLTPAADLPLGPYTGSLLVSGNSASVSVPFDFRAISDQIGALSVTAVDEYTFYAAGAPTVTNATLRLLDSVTHDSILSTNLGASGHVVLTGLTEADYQLEVTADAHSTYSSAIHIHAGVTNQVNAFLSRQTVQYTWTVVPTQITNQGTVRIDTTFETFVPVPVVTVSPASFDLASIAGNCTQVNLTIANHGLIAANHVKLNLPTHPGWNFTSIISDIGVLPANSTLTIPVQICRNSSSSGDTGTGSGNSGNGNGGSGSVVIDPTNDGKPPVQPPGGNGGNGGSSNTVGDCTVTGVLTWDLICGDFVIAHTVSFVYLNAATDCGAAGIPSAFGGGGGGGGGIIYINIPVHIASGVNCDPCVQRRIISLAKCTRDFAIGLLPDPAPCMWDVYQLFEGFREDVAAGRTPATVANALGLAGTVLDCGKFGLKVAGSEAEPNPFIGPAIWAISCTWDLCHACDGLPNHTIENDCVKLAKSYLPFRSQRRSNFDRPLDTSSSLLDDSEAILAPLYDQAARIQDLVAPARYVYGDDAWWLVSDVASERQLVDQLRAAADISSDGGAIITDAELQAALAGTIPSPLTPEIVSSLVHRLNRTTDYYSRGIFAASDVPLGQSVDFIDLDVLNGLVVASKLAWAEIVGAGYSNPIQEWLDIRAKVTSQLNGDGSGVCAKVRLEIDQSTVLTRDAFAATLTMDDHSSVPLNQVRVTLDVRTVSGAEATNLFVIRPPVLSNVGALDGTGVISAGATASAKWTIIPTRDAAPTNAVDYFVSGLATYVQNGVQISIPLAPTQIHVLPQPSLTLQYFLERNVYADDPFTAQIEPSIPFSLALLACNKGAGTAHNFQITSAQPKIIENEKGLLIHFNMIASDVDGQNLNPSLTANLGDLAPGSCKEARWLMTSSLQGLFTEYSATYQDVDDLGNPRASLVDALSIHEMVHLVEAGTPYGAGFPYFLVNDHLDPDHLPDTLYFHDGSTNSVTPIVSATVDSDASELRPSVHLSVNAGPGWNYFRVADPSQGNMILTRVVRSDGLELPVTKQVWTTDRTFVGLGKRPINENLVHILDLSGTGEYTLYYQPLAPAVTQPPLSRVADLPDRVPASFGVQWSGSAAQGTGIGYFDLFVSDNGGPFVPWLIQTQLRGGVYTGAVGHTYAFYSVATDLAGNRESAPSSGQATTVVGYESAGPTLSRIADRSTPVNAAIDGIVLNITDSTVPEDQWLLGVDSSNPTLIPVSSITVTGSGVTRTLRVVPSTDRVGRSILTVTLRDGHNQASTQFTIDVVRPPLPPVASSAEFTYQPGSPQKISVFDILTNDVDPNGLPLTITDVSSPSIHGAAVSLLGRWIIYTPVDSTPQFDSFNYTVSNGGASSVGTVNMTPMTSGGNGFGANQLSASLGTNGSVHLEFQGIPGRTYDIQYSTRLVDPVWTTLGHQTADINGLLQFDDGTAPGVGSRFYRTTEHAP